MIILIENIIENLKQPLPGKQAHKELAPYRNEIELDFKNKNPKIASTLLLIYPKNDSLFFCLIHRNKYQGTHSNQISFPGGKNEIGESMKETALRETKEEIGIDPISINIIGELTQVEEIDKARAVDIKNLKHPEKDEDRAKNPEWLVMLGVCTHLGCVPLGDKGEYGGWFCPCHGSHYDTSGRIRKGPAPTNMEIPKYEFVNTDIIKIG